MDGRTDTPSFRDATAHLKMIKKSPLQKNPEKEDEKKESKRWKKKRKKKATMKRGGGWSEQNLVGGEEKKWMKWSWKKARNSIGTLKRKSVGACTVGQNTRKHRTNSYPIIHCPTCERVSEMSERANEWAQWSAQAKRAKWAVRSRQTSERTSEWPNTYIGILGYSGS